MATAVPMTELLADAVNGAFLIFAGALVFYMKAGFALLEAGSVTKSSVLSIVLKNNVDMGFGILFYWAVGWAWAFGDNDLGNGFIGTGQYFALSMPTSTYPLWFYEFAFAAAAVTIVSGAIAERVYFQAYLIYACFGYAWIQPVIAHWVWSGTGWLSCFRPEADLLFGVGMLDFAGGGAVHMVGGASALAALLFVGFRNRYIEPAQRERARHPERLMPRYEQDASGNWKQNPLPGSSGLMVALGVFILFFGWLGFNAGSVIALVGESTINGLPQTISRAGAAGRTIVCTLMAAGCGMITAMVLGRIEARNEPFHKWSLAECMNGILAGLVCITPGAGYVEVWASIVFGVIGACVYKLISMAMSSVRVRLDDPVDAVAVHLGGGMAGLFLVGCLADPEYVQEIGCSSGQGGAFYVSSGGLGMRLGAQMLGIVCILAFCFFFSFVIWGIMYLIDRNRGENSWFLIRSSRQGQITLKTTDRDEELQMAFQPSSFKFAEDSKTNDDGDMEEVGDAGDVAGQFSEGDVELDNLDAAFTKKGVEL